MAKSKEEKAVYASLLDQLKAKNIETEYTRSRIDDYMASWRTVKQLTDDIEKRGIKCETELASGAIVLKMNESIGARQKENAAMDKILQSLGLNAPVIKSDDLGDYL